MGQCAFCGHAIDEENGPIEYDGDGLPYALAGAPGFGVPWGRAVKSFEVWLDGKLVSHVVAFDRRKGFVVRPQQIDGQFINRRGGFQHEKLRGNVRLVAARD